MEEISDDTMFFLDIQFSCVYSAGFVGYSFLTFKLSWPCHLTMTNHNF